MVTTVKEFWEVFGTLVDVVTMDELESDPGLVNLKNHKCKTGRLLMFRNGTHDGVICDGCGRFATRPTPNTEPNTPKDPNSKSKVKSEVKEDTKADTKVEIHFTPELPPRTIIKRRGK